MKFALGLTFAAAVSAANGACEENTCRTCTMDSLCGWYTSFITGGAAGDAASTCKLKTEVTGSAVLAEALTEVTDCPACQAGICSDCFFNVSSGCQWMKSDVGIGSYCTDGTEAAKFAFTAVADSSGCPTCEALSLDSCTGCSQGLADCNWYTPLLGSGKCSDSEPFGMTLVVEEACSGNPCTKASDCSSCAAITKNVSGTETKVCSWLTPKDFYAPFQGPKCDLVDPGLIDNKLYDIVGNTETCPKCAANTCTDCQAETGCKFYATKVLGAYGFGKCVEDSAAAPFGKEEIPTCKSECDIYSCTACKENTKCAWYPGNAINNAGCDLKDDPSVLSHVGISPSTTCPQCAYSRCFECNEDTGSEGCNWWMQGAFGQSVPGTGDCQIRSKATVFEMEIFPEDEECVINTDGAAQLVPGLLFAVVLAAM